MTDTDCCAIAPIYAHCIHFDQTDRARMAQSGGIGRVLPSSNLHLGSGLLMWLRPMRPECGFRLRRM